MEDPDLNKNCLNLLAENKSIFFVLGKLVARDSFEIVKFLIKACNMQCFVKWFQKIRMF